MITGYPFNPKVETPSWPKGVRRRLVAGVLAKKPQEETHELVMVDGSTVPISPGQCIEYAPTTEGYVALRVVDEQGDQVIDDRLPPREPICGYPGT